LKRFITYFVAISTLVLSFGIIFRRAILASILQIPAPKNRVTIEHGIQITIEAGITLVTDHYVPVSVADAPTILMRSPYGRNTQQSGYGRILEFFANCFAERGYHVLVQDVRGRFDSDGEFDPYLNEKADGLATVAWLRQQSWFNGKLCLWGASYLGMTQWLIAHEVPEVKAMMPIFAASQLYPILFPDGVINYGLITRWIAIFKLMDERYEKRSLFHMLHYPQEVERLARQVRFHLPVTTADVKLLGHEDKFYQRLEHNIDANSELWQSINTMSDIEQVDAAVHLIGGWYDLFLRQQLQDYRRLKAAGKQPYLTIGKWMHFNNVNGLLSGIQEGLSFFDYHTQANGTRLREKPVRIFVMGADEWRDLPDFPPPTTQSTLFLNAGQLSSTAATTRGERSYRYNPADPTPAIGGVQFTFDTFPVKDNRRLQKRRDVLTFIGTPLQHPLEIMGEARVILYVQSTAESADFFARLCDVTPDGRALNIADGLFRIEAGANGQTHCVEINLFPTAYQFQVGHRIQLMIASAFHPHWARNLGTSESYILSTTIKPAMQTIFFGGDTPSRLMLPISN
jgi:putative CocE/NonD family hydrolase